MLYANLFNDVANYIMYQETIEPMISNKTKKPNSKIYLDMLLVEITYKKKQKFLRTSVTYCVKTTQKFHHIQLSFVYRLLGRY